MMPMKSYKKIETIVLYSVIKKKSWEKLPKRPGPWDYILKVVIVCSGFFYNCI